MEIDIENSRKKLDEIEFALAANDWGSNYGIYGGKSGYLIFLNELARLKNEEEKYEPVMTKICEGLFDDLQQDNITPSYSSGLAGLVYVLQHIGLNELIDDPIFECINLNAYDCSKRNNYDFLYGSAGMVYALSEAGYSDLSFFTSWIELTDGKFNLFSDGYRIPVYFKDHPFSHNDYQYNFSLSHGLAAMVVVITGLLEKKQVDEKYNELAVKMIDSILGRRNTHVTHENGFYPSIIQMNDKRHYFKRISWCYGDLGVAIMLNRYMKYSGNTKYRDTIIEILDHYLQYTRAEDLEVRDADFCHGAAGTAIIYLYFYQEFGDEKYRVAANRWFNIMLEMDTYADGAAGYKHYDPAGNYNEYGLLEGIAGIGLTIISFLSGKKLNWQTCFLMH